jgi:hypothetical protein
MNSVSIKPIDIADALLCQIRAAKLPGAWAREVRFHPTRKWRIDIADVENKIAVECEGFGRAGGIGRHQSVSGLHADCEKYSELAISGFRLIRCTGRQVKSGEALNWIERAIKETP